MKYLCISRLLGKLTLLSLAGAGLSACTEGVLSPRGAVGEQEKQLLIEALVPMLLVVVPVIGLTLWFAWWFRASNARATYRPHWEYSGTIEFLIWVIPLLIILFVGTLAWSGAHTLDPYRPLVGNRKPVQVQVIALDWRWLFVYPEQGVASINELTLPKDTPISFRLTSATVMNSFFIPSLGGQIYAMPGMETRLSLISDTPGVYRGLSAQFSGDGFSDMHFVASVVTDADFDAWVKHARSAETSLNAVSYDTLAIEHKTASVSYFASVEGDIFSHAMQTATSRKTPVGAAQQGQSTTAVYAITEQ